MSAEILQAVADAFESTPGIDAHTRITRAVNALRAEAGRRSMPRPTMADIDAALKRRLENERPAREARMRESEARITALRRTQFTEFCAELGVQINPEEADALLAQATNEVARSFVIWQSSSHLIAQYRAEEASS